MVGIAQIEARNALLPELVGAEANPRQFFAGLVLDGNAGVNPSRAVGAPFWSSLQAAPFEIWPLTRGATNVTCPFTYASSVETVLRAKRIQGMPNTPAAARIRAPSTPIRSLRLRVN